MAATLIVVAELTWMPRFRVTRGAAMASECSEPEHLCSLSSMTNEGLGPALTSALTALDDAQRGAGPPVLCSAYDGQVNPSGSLPVPLGAMRRRSLLKTGRTHARPRANRSARFTGWLRCCNFCDLWGGSRARPLANSGDPSAEDPGCAFEPSHALQTIVRSVRHAATEPEANSVDFSGWWPGS